MKILIDIIFFNYFPIWTKSPQILPFLSEIYVSPNFRISFLKLARRSNLNRVGNLRQWEEQ
jgi:hypothetical protein